MGYGWDGWGWGWGGWVLMVTNDASAVTTR